MSGPCPSSGPLHPSPSPAAQPASSLSFPPSDVCDPFPAHAPASQAPDSGRVSVHDLVCRLAYVSAPRSPEGAPNKGSSSLGSEHAPQRQQLETDVLKTHHGNANRYRWQSCSPPGSIGWPYVMLRSGADADVVAAEAKIEARRQALRARSEEGVQDQRRARVEYGKAILESLRAGLLVEPRTLAKVEQLGQSNRTRYWPAEYSFVQRDSRGANVVAGADRPNFVDPFPISAGVVARRVYECQPARAEATVALLRHDRGGPCSGGLMDNRVKVN